MKDRGDDEQLGELLQEFVNRVSHPKGNTLTVLTDESVTGVAELSTKV